MNAVKVPCPGRQNEKIKCHNAQNQSYNDVKHSGNTCIFLISIRDDDIVILHLPMGKCLHHLALLRISPACILFYNGHIVQGLLVALVNLENLVQAAPGLIKVLPGHI